MSKVISYIISITLLFSIFHFTTNPVYSQVADGVSYKLGFKIMDSAIDPTQTVLYATAVNSRNIYKFDYITGKITHIILPYIAEKLDMVNGFLYITQKMQQHKESNEKWFGKIAKVRISDFKMVDSMDVDIDPFDIAVDKDNYVYITNGSGQWVEMGVYSFETKSKIINDDIGTICSKCTLEYDQNKSKLYTIENHFESSTLYCNNVANGKISDTIRYNFDKEITSFAIGPDGKWLYTSAGILLQESKLSSINYKGIALKHPYNHFEFDTVNNLVYAARQDSGIDVYKYGSANRLYSIQYEQTVKDLFYRNGIIEILKDQKGVESVRFIKNYKPSKNSFLFAKTAFLTEKKAVKTETFSNSKKEIPLGAVYLFYFNQNIIISDKSKITLKQGKNKVSLKSMTLDNILIIDPSGMKGNTSYTISIKKGALDGLISKDSNPEKTCQFRTIKPIHVPKPSKFEAINIGGRVTLKWSKVLVKNHNVRYCVSKYDITAKKYVTYFTTTNTSYTCSVDKKNKFSLYAFIYKKGDIMKSALGYSKISDIKLPQ